MEKREMSVEEKIRWKWVKDYAVVLDALAGRTESKNGQEALHRLMGHLSDLGEYVSKRAEKGSPICKRMVKKLSEDHVR